jgi:hypothetical protein
MNNQLQQIHRTLVPHGPTGRKAALLQAAESSGKALIDWPSKGVDYYAFLNASNNSGAAFSQPVDWGRSAAVYTLDAVGVMQTGNLQIAENDIGVGHTGQFSWTATQSGTTLQSGFADIAPSTGLLGNTNLGDMLATPSTFGSGWALSYGFYDSGPGIGPLTDQDQSYVYLTADQSAWMGALAQSLGADFSSLPLNVFALPGAHDSGMFDTTCLAQLIANNSFLIALAAAAGWAIEPLLKLSTSAILRTAINLAFTQKDNITAMLNLGVRYFDVRPGYCYQNLAPGIFHQHNFIPGYPYQNVLEDILTWLAAHPSEIVVVSANFQGFADSAMQPSADALLQVLSAAQQATNTGQSINIGDKSDLSTSYSDLLSAGKQLLFLNQIGAADDAVKYDSYNNSYQTADVNVILQALEAMNESGQASSNYTVLQLQGTATGVSGGLFDLIALLSDASSPLLSTKPGFDNQTYPWVTNNVPSALSSSQLVIFLNDFIDGVLAISAASVTTARARSLLNQLQ